MRDLLPDRSTFEFPKRFRVEGGTHPDRLDPQRGIEGIGGNGQVILRHDLLGVGVGVAPQRGTDRGELGCGEPGAPAEHHVFLGVGHPREPFRRLVGTGEVVDLGGHDRRQCVPDDDHPKPVLERRPDDILFPSRPRGDRKEKEHRNCKGNKIFDDCVHAIPLFGSSFHGPFARKKSSVFNGIDACRIELVLRLPRAGGAAVDHRTGNMASLPDVPR